MSESLSMGLGAIAMVLMSISLVSVSVVVLDWPARGRVGRILHSPWWAILAWLLVIPWTCGQFARGELSANPWTMALAAYHRAGAGVAALELVRVLLADTWLFTGFAAYGLRTRLDNVERLRREGVDAAHATQLRLAALHQHRRTVIWNLLLGAIATARGGPIYLLLSYL